MIFGVSGNLDVIRTSKGELARGDASGRQKTRELQQKGEDLFLGVKHTREFVLDAEANSVLGKIISEQALNIDVALSSDSPPEFVQKAKNWMARQQGELDEAARWSAFARLAGQHFPVCPGLSFVYGPIPTVPPVRKESKARAAKDDVAPLKQVGELKDEDEDPEILAQATMQQVDRMDQLLQKTGKFPVWQLVSNPQSMAQTVEHMFHLAFLVKAGKARISKEKANGNAPIVQPADAPDIVDEGVERIQAVVRVDMKQLMGATQRYSIPVENPLIPHRIPREYLPNTQPVIQGMEADEADEDDDEIPSSISRTPAVAARMSTSPAVDPTQLLDSPALTTPVTGKKKRQKR